MRRVPVLAVVWLAALVTGAAVVDRPEAVRAPELVGDGVVSKVDRNETFPAIDPVDGSLWYSVYENSFDAQTIMVARRSGASWLEAQAAPFSGRWGDRAPRFSPDGRRLYFTSNRPRTAGGARGDMNIWVVERSAAGEWSEPRLLPEPVNTGSREIHNVETANGTIYLASDRPGGRGRSDIYRFTRSGEAWTGTSVTAVNDSLSQPDLLVSPDEEWMILAITDHARGLGGDDLFISRRTGATWSAPSPLGAPINSSEYEYGPTLSPDGRYIYYTSHRRNGSADVYRVSVAEVLGSR